MTRDPGRPGVIQLSSFVDMESAESFLRFEAERGLDLGRVMLYWALPVDISEDKQVAAGPLAEVPVPIGPPVTAAPAYAAPTPIAAPTYVAPAAVAPAPARAVHRVVGAPKEIAKPSGKKGGPKKAAPSGPGMIDELRAWPGWKGMRRRVLMAMLLQGELYAEIKDDPLAIGQARVVILASAFAAALGAVFGGPVAMLMYFAASLIGWGAYAMTAHWVAVIFKGQEAEGGLNTSLLAFGFASAPRLFFILAIIPTYGPLLVMMVLVWVAVTTTVAAKHALEMEESEAAITAMVSCLALFAASVVSAAILV